MKMRKNRTNKQNPYPVNRVIRDTLSLLSIHPGFQTDVMRLREKFGIPLDGYSSVDESQTVQLHRWENQLNTDAQNGSDTDQLLAKSVELLRKFHLSELHAFKIATYVLSGNVDEFTNTIIMNYRINLPPGNLPELEQQGLRVNSPNPIAPVTIGIFGPLTIRDVKKLGVHANTLIKKYYPELAESYHPYPNLKRDIEIMRLTYEKKQEKKKHGFVLPGLPINEEPGILSDAEIADRLSISVDDVRHGRRRLWTRLHQRFPHDTFPPT